MSEITINTTLKQLRGSLATVGESLIDVAERFRADQEIAKTIKGQIEQINENYLFVIVGEVNAGKSSLINSVLKTPIAETSHEICTQDVIKIVHGEERKTERDHATRIVVKTDPAEILKDITIVDTPGTNSRELDHQIITEGFIPHANLVVFVFQVDNIHVQSAWDLFKTIKEDWGKKIIFVLTKSDRYTDEEIVNYTSTLSRYIEKEGIEQPNIFVTSSKLEADGYGEKGGFPKLRTYINTEILNGAAFSKLRDDVQTIGRLKGRIDAEFKGRQERFDNDHSTRKRINTLVETKDKLANTNIRTLVQRCLDAYDMHTNQTIDKLKKGIGFIPLTVKSIGSIFGGQPPHEWLQEMNREHVVRLNEEINRILQAGSDSIKSDITYMVIGVKEEIDNLQGLHFEPSEMFTELDMQRSDLISSLRTNLNDFIEKSEVFTKTPAVTDQGVHYSEVNVAGGIAAVGTAIAVIGKAAIFDITGGIATGLALITAGGIAVFKKGKYINAVRDALNEKRSEFKEQLENNLTGYFGQIRDQVNQRFGAFDDHVRTEGEYLREYAETAHRIKNDLATIERKLEE